MNADSLSVFSALLFLVSSSLPAVAQIREVVVGVTPTCPYGLTGCWGGAAEGLSRLEGVESVGKAPDAYNSTAHVYLKDRDALPDLGKWRRDFKAVTNDVYGFRGVEVTIEAEVILKNGVPSLKLPSGRRDLPLVPLKHKLQWNFKKGSPRQPEPDEATAYESLRAAVQEAAKGELRVLVTGPLIEKDGLPALEVREFFAVTQ